MPHIPDLGEVMGSASQTDKYVRYLPGCLLYERVCGIECTRWYRAGLDAIIEGREQTNILYTIATYY